MKKSSLTLLEVMIALFLAGILLSTVMMGYKKITSAQVKIEKAKAEVLSHQLIEQRLLNIFNHLHVETVVKGKKKTVTCLYTQTLADCKGVALICEYDNGVDPDPEFCHQIKSELYLNQKNELCLNSYSKSGKVRKEVLKNNLSDLRFEFLDLEGKESTSHTWDFNRSELPPVVMLALTVKKGTPPVEFAFFIPQGEGEIIYEKGPS